ncbi:NfeD family protein [Trinickia fusca]|uniref:NfeD family protein n=1 Tax=Trinickia fusca TaxID=2419777 RepID=A0A494XQ05_9BURK|nr:NfeD family protein [Trinickia fusca]RKP52698.1 NfeD family protein [Trinickia fusca]
MGPSDFFWWVGAGALIVAELLTGTFYLLMIALGFIAGAIAHLAGASAAAQYAWAALIALVAVIALRRSRWGQRRQRRDATSNPDVNLDVGAVLEVTTWHERRARVPYRGAQWDVELAPDAHEDARVYEVAAVRGSCLILADKRPPASSRAHHPLSTTKE